MLGVRNSPSPQDGSPRPGPFRTCVGCRRTEQVSSDLLRVVLTNNHSAVVPDWRRKLPGRGAWVHRTGECVRLALERRAFPRALRTSLDVDVSALQELAATGGVDDPPCGGAGEEEKEMDHNR